MTACFRLMRTFQKGSRVDTDPLCPSCVYFSKNLDVKEYPDLKELQERCGLGFQPGDVACTEMRTDNCRTRRIRD